MGVVVRPPPSTSASRTREAPHPHPPSASPTASPAPHPTLCPNAPRRPCCPSPVTGRQPAAGQAPIETDRPSDGGGEDRRQRPRSAERDRATSTFSSTAHWPHPVTPRSTPSAIPLASPPATRRCAEGKPVTGEPWLVGHTPTPKGGHATDERVRGRLHRRWSARASATPTATSVEASSTTPRTSAASTPASATRPAAHARRGAGQRRAAMRAPTRVTTTAAEATAAGRRSRKGQGATAWTTSAATAASSPQPSGANV